MTSTRRWGAVWALLVASSGVYFLGDNEADNDLWVHVRIGLQVISEGVPRVDTWSYTAAGLPWIDHEWLLHVLFGGLYGAGGGPALLLFKIAAGLATLALLAVSVSRRAASIHVRGGVLVLATAVLSRGFAVRPQIATYLAVAALWLFLDTPRRRDSGQRWWLVPVFVLWANLHGGVVVGLGMTGICAVWLLLARPADGVRLGLAAGLGAAAALLLNPYGPAYAGFIVGELGSPHPITEWQPVALEPAQATFLVLAAAFVGSLPLLRGWRERGWQAALAALVLAAAFAQQRHTPVFALCAAPLVAEGAEALARRVRRRGAWSLSPGAQGLLAAGMVGLALAQLGLTAARLWGDRLRIVFDPAEYPVEAVRRLAAGAEPLNLAVPLEWGGYAVWHLGPRVKVSLDGRFAMIYPPEVVEENFAFFSGRDDFRALADRHPTDAILAPAGARPPVSASTGWRTVHEDPVATILAREGVALPEGTTAPTSAAGAFP